MRVIGVRQQGIMQGLYPDGKAQVAIEYENHTPIAVANLVISTHHAPGVSLRDLRYQLIEYVMKPVIPDRILWRQVVDRERDRLDNTVIFVNPAGASLAGGPKADAGLTGRKTIVETYGGMGRHPIYRATAAIDILVARNAPGSLRLCRRGTAPHEVRPGGPRSISRRL